MSEEKHVYLDTYCKNCGQGERTLYGALEDITKEYAGDCHRRVKSVNFDVVFYDDDFSHDSSGGFSMDYDSCFGSKSQRIDK